MSFQWFVVGLRSPVVFKVVLGSRFVDRGCDCKQWSVAFPVVTLKLLQYSMIIIVRMNSQGRLD